MTGFADGLALLVAAGGLVAAALVLGRTRRVAVALPVLLDLLTAAGLLRLAADPDLRRLLAAALVVSVRQLASLGLGVARRAGRPGRPSELNRR